MRYFILLLVLVFACSKEEISENIVAPFKCNINGENFNDYNPTYSVNNSDVLTINAEDGDNNIIINIIGFSTREINNTFSFTTPGMGTVLYNGKTYYNTSNTSDGSFTFTEISSNGFSSSFNFKGTSSNFEHIYITNGIYSNIND